MLCHVFLHFIIPVADVEKSLEWIDRVVHFYQVGEEVEVKIRDGPGGCIEDYLQVMQKVWMAMEHFHQFNPDSLELEHLSELFYSGREALVREFLLLLKKHSKPVHVATLHDIAVCEDADGM